MKNQVKKLLVPGAGPGMLFSQATVPFPSPPLQVLRLPDLEGTPLSSPGDSATLQYVQQEQTRKAKNDFIGEIF